MDYEDEWVALQPKRSAHKVHMLRRRELGRIKEGTHSMRARRDFFQSIPLDHSLIIPERAPTHPVAFSPDGKYLVTFNKNFRTIYIHKYLGVERGVGFDAEDACKRILPLIGEMTLHGQWMANASLIKDFALFTEDGRHMIICACAPLGDNVNLNAVYRNNESLPLGTHGLERYALIVIDIQKVAMCDVFCMVADRVALQQGVSIRGRTISILSWQHQNIYIVNVDAKGKFILLKTVGPSVLDDDELFLKIEHGNFGRATSVLSGFKQKLFTFLYKKCKREGGMSVHLFHRAMGTLQQLKMWRLHMMDSQHLFIRMTEDIRHTREPANHPHMQPFFNIIFNWKNAEIVHVFHVSDYVDDGYFSFFEQFSEQLTTNSLTVNQFPCTVSHCAPARAMFRKVWSEMSKTRQEAAAMGSGTPGMMTRRLLYTLPWGCSLQPQTSAYLDPTLFYYDDRTLHAILRGRLGRNTDLSMFMCSNGAPQRLCTLRFAGESAYQSLMFHPTDPFAISIDRNNPELQLTLFMPSGDQL